jgi:hypothetical protein
MTYRQSGIEYREANFAYNTTDATVSVSPLNCTTSLTLSYNYGYRDPSLTYRQANVAYRPDTSTGTNVKVTAQPATLAITAEFSANAGLPVTVVIGSPIAAVGAVLPANANSNAVITYQGIEVTTGFPTIIFSYTEEPDAIAATAAFPAVTMYLTISAEPVHVAGIVAVPTANANSNYTFNAQTIECTATGFANPVYRLLQMPVADTLPPVGMRLDTDIQAYALRRHYAPSAQGINLFIINGTSVQTYLPYAQIGVTRWLLGGHKSPTDLTANEETVLVAAGYKFDVGPEQ